MIPNREDREFLRQAQELKWRNAFTKDEEAMWRLEEAKWRIEEAKWRDMMKRDAFNQAFGMFDNDGFYVKKPNGMWLVDRQNEFDQKAERIMNVIDNEEFAVSPLKPLRVRDWEKVIYLISYNCHLYFII